MQGRQSLFTFLTVTRWSRSASNFYVLIGQNLTGEFMRKIYAASGNLLTDSWSWQSFVSSCDVLNCLLLLGVQNEIQLLSRYPGPRGFSWFFFAKEIKSKPQQWVDKATRRERKTSGYLGLESHFHEDDSCQTRQITNKKSDQWQFSKHVPKGMGHKSTGKNEKW